MITETGNVITENCYRDRWSGQSVIEHFAANSFTLARKWLPRAATAIPGAGTVFSLLWMPAQ